MQGRRDELTGRRRQLSGSVRTEREAVELERTFRLQVERGLTARLTVGELVQEWWEGCPRLAATTLANYRSNLDVHVLPVLGDKLVEAIRPSTRARSAATSSGVASVRSRSTCQRMAGSPSSSRWISSTAAD